jgi:hypothetical protein
MGKWGNGEMGKWGNGVGDKRESFVTDPIVLPLSWALLKNKKKLI